MMKKSLLIALFIAMLIVDAQAQCSMCKAVVESSQKTGTEFAEGLNAGILYLMGIPYALLVFIGILLFRRLNRQEAEQ